jgi:hypothetical protein
MCIRCVMKVASTFKKYITYNVTLIKLVKLVKLVFGSWLVSSAAMHLVRIEIYILSELRAGCMLLCSQLQSLFLHMLYLLRAGYMLCRVMLWCWWYMNFSVKWNLLEIITIISHDIVSAQLCTVCLQPTNVSVTHSIKQFCTSHLREYNSHHLLQKPQTKLHASCSRIWLADTKLLKYEPPSKSVTRLSYY